LLRVVFVVLGLEKQERKNGHYYQTHNEEGMGKIASLHPSPCVLSFPILNNVSNKQWLVLVRTQLDFLT